MMHFLIVINKERKAHSQINLLGDSNFRYINWNKKVLLIDCTSTTYSK